MSSVWGRNIHISLFGESHSSAIGVVVDGLPAGISIDMDRVAACMKRRKPVGAAHSTQRKETDAVEIVSGLFEGHTTGTPLCGIIKNRDQHSSDYHELRFRPRPSHADHTAYIKYNGFQDYRGGGHFSGRLTAPLVFAGAIAEHLLDGAGVHVGAHIYSIGDCMDTPFTQKTSAADLDALQQKAFPVLDDEAGARMQRQVSLARMDLDSIGGVVECAVIPMPQGLGDPMFGSLESIVSGLLFSIPAVKGVEFGDGFAISQLRGSVANDAPVVLQNDISYKSNHNGGVLGGISNGMPLIVRAALKPTPSIAAEQDTVNLETMENTTIQIKGRHDACIVPRAAEAVRCAVALCIADMLLEDKKYD